MSRLDILLPTRDRLLSLTMTLAGIAEQVFEGFRLIVADQSRESALREPTIATLKRVIETRAAPVEWIHRSDCLGIAEQRNFLLEQASAAHVLYIDDDVLMEPWVVQRLFDVLQSERCGFVGAFPAGLSFIDDERPDQQAIEFWDGPVRPEAIDPQSPQWQRYHLHRAANLFHAARRYAPVRPRLYKVAWVGSCVMYDRRKLLEVGGFSFWPRLPRFHAGEEALVQNLLMRRWGGCAMMPAGTYHAEEPSTVLNDRGRVDGHAMNLLKEMTESRVPVVPYD